MLTNIVHFDCLGVDLMMTSELGQCYYFFSYTRYPRHTPVYTRDRQTRDGHCWSQRGAKERVIDDNTVIGWKKKLTFVVNSTDRKTYRIMLGPNAYSFMVHELISGEDEDEEKMMRLQRKTPRSFLSVNKLYPILQRKIEQQDLQQRDPTYPRPDGQSFPLVSGSSHDTLSRVPDLESPPSLQMDSAQQESPTEREVSPQTIEKPAVSF